MNPNVPILPKANEELDFSSHINIQHNLMSNQLPQLDPCSSINFNFLAMDTLKPSTLGAKEVPQNPVPLNTALENINITHPFISGQSIELRSGRPKKRTDGLDEFESTVRKYARAARNRVAARKSREKKKFNIEQLKEENATLAEENTRLSSLLKTSEARRLQLESTLFHIFSSIQDLNPIKDSLKFNDDYLSSLGIEYNDSQQVYDPISLLTSNPDNGLLSSKKAMNQLFSDRYSDNTSSSTLLTQRSPLHGDLCESAVLVQLRS
ncbi:hypothetical protein BB560_002798 [Smittium megazygosporum]|uniref:BZIP domain-containing protein n=1 Tax=Smittium megazygosporum TaxID=133381 RepID=A0A2T9ZDS6_9FUNG|nr:hypothetical protein BB560_002798 [Smittium megazygosporum]